MKKIIKNWTIKKDLATKKFIDTIDFFRNFSFERSYLVNVLIFSNSFMSFERTLIKLLKEKILLRRKKSLIDKKIFRDTRKNFITLKFITLIIIFIGMNYIFFLTDILDSSKRFFVNRIYASQVIQVSDARSKASQIKNIKDLSKNGFTIVDEQVYFVSHQILGDINFIPVIDKEYNRIALFFTNDKDDVLFYIDDLECNFWSMENETQVVISIPGIAFVDLNHDGLLDIIVVAVCKNDTGVMYRIGDVLFQNESGYYRDWRISDKLNRFDMSKNIHSIITFLRDGKSTEYLYTSKKVDELVINGFEIMEAQSFTTNLEKFGVVDIVSGFYNMSGQNFLMVYLVDKDNNILWNFQPMHDYVNFYSISEFSITDIDGDGLKDMIILANYVELDDPGDSYIKKDYNLYYQKAGYFVEDLEMKDLYKCEESDTIDSVVDNIRQNRRWSLQ